jgi:shikimate 5-dehydrogenase
VRSLEEANVPLDDARVLLLGAGGAARAAAVGLCRRGAAEVVVVARRLEQCDALVRELNPVVGGRLRALGEDDAAGSARRLPRHHALGAGHERHPARPALTRRPSPTRCRSSCCPTTRAWWTWSTSRASPA